MVESTSAFWIILNHLLRCANDWYWNAKVVQYPVDPWKNSGIGNVATIPRYQVVYPMVRRHRDVKSVK